MICLVPLCALEHPAREQHRVLHVGAPLEVPAHLGQPFGWHLPRDTSEADEPEVVAGELARDERVQRHRDLLGRQEVVAHRHRERHVEEQHGGAAGELLGPLDLEVVGGELHRRSRALTPDGVLHRLLHVEAERVAPLVGLVLVRGVVADAFAVLLVTAGAVLHELAEEVAERLVADGPDAARRELEPALALLDEPGVLEHPGELGEPLERPRRVVAEELAGTVDVDLGELARLRRLAQEVLEVVHVAERVEEPGHLAHRERVVAAERHRALPRQVRERLLEVAGELVDLPAQVHVLEERLGELLELRALLGRHRVHELLHLRHRLRHLLEQLVEASAGCRGRSRRSAP